MAYITAAVISIGLFLSAFFIHKEQSPTVLFGNTPASTIQQGGTGWNNFALGTIPIGGGLGALRFATSSLLTFATTTNTLSVGNLVFISASSTNLSATGSFFVPKTTSLPTNTVDGSLSFNSASSSLNFGSGKAVYATSSISFYWATTTMATDTIPFTEGIRGKLVGSMSCSSTGGKGTIAIGNGISTSTYLQCITTSIKTATAVNFPIDSRTRFYVAIGSYDATAMSVSPAFDYQNTY